MTTKTPKEFKIPETLVEALLAGYQIFMEYTDRWKPVGGVLGHELREGYILLTNPFVDAAPDLRLPYTAKLTFGKPHLTPPSEK